MKRMILLLLTFFLVFSLSSSAGSTTALAEAPQTQYATATDAELSLDALKNGDDVRAYLDSVLPYEGDGELIPYVASLYSPGDCTLGFSLQGLCTRDGQIVTKPIFTAIQSVTPVGYIWPEGTPEELFLCYIPYSYGHGDALLITPDGKPMGWRSSLVGHYQYNSSRKIDPWFGELDFWFAVQDDGTYHVDRAEGKGYAILRSSDGVQVARTDWWGLAFCKLKDGSKIYFTSDDGYCWTYDQDFRPILRVPDQNPDNIDPFFTNTDPFANLEDSFCGEYGNICHTLNLTAQQRYEANLFLSNFSEQRFSLPWDGNGNWSADADDERLLSFAHLWALCNRPELVSREGAFDIMDLDAVNAIVDRFFIGRTISPAKGTDHTSDLVLGEESPWFYCDGKFYFPSNSDMAFNCFTVVEKAFSWENGNMEFHFTVYELDEEIYAKEGEIPDRYYHLTPEEAAQLAETGELRKITDHSSDSGYAICATRTRPDNGQEGYTLLDYNLYE